MNGASPDTRREPDTPAGSATWWLTRTAPPVYRRGRPPRSRERIVGEALALLDEVGADVFSMRLLAQRLGSGTATLYRHFAGKDEIMAYVVDRIIGELDAEIGQPALGVEWRQATERWACGLHEVLMHHPNALPLFASQVPVGPNALAKREQSLSLLLAGGFDRDLSARVYTAIAHYVVGFTLQQHGSQLSGEDDSMSLRGYFQSLDPRTYPATVAAANELTGVRLQDEFQFGLQLILDGAERTRDVRTA